jgi:cytosine/adenosine deaminase-related metal-dependent hydrolase
VLGGTTCVATYGVTTGSTSACEDALRDFGMRGTVTIRDDAFRASPGARGSAWEREPRAHYRLHAEERLDEAELAAAARAHGRGEHIVMHAAETMTRLGLVQQRFGTTTIRLLDRYGLLSPAVLLSHAVHVDDEEIRLMARRGVRVVVSPAAEMKLSDGLPPVRDMIRHGITVALGTDAAVCNNARTCFWRCDCWACPRSCATAPPRRRRSRSCAWPHAQARPCSAVPAGSAASPQGMAADLILVDAASPRMQPLRTGGAHSNLAPNLVYAATGGRRYGRHDRRPLGRAAAPAAGADGRAIRCSLRSAAATLQRYLQRAT